MMGQQLQHSRSTRPSQTSLAKEPNPFDSVTKYLREVQLIQQVVLDDLSEVIEAILF